MKYFILIPMALLHLNAISQVKLYDIYKFTTVKDSTVIWEFSDRVVRKSWRHGDDTTAPLQQKMYLVEETPDAAWELDSMVLICYKAQYNDNEVRIYISQNQNTEEYRYIIYLEGENTTLIYPIKKTTYPKKTIEIY